MNKRNPLIIIFSCLLSAVAGIGFGVALALLARVVFASGDPSVLNIALYCLLGGVVAVIGLAVLLFLSRPRKPKNAIPEGFLNQHPELKDEEGLLRKARIEPTRGIGALTTVILSSLSDDERAEVSPRLNEILLGKILELFPESNSTVAFSSPNIFYFLTEKGDIKAKIEEVSKQALDAIALDPTMPDVRLMFGLENSQEAMDPFTRMKHARVASNYDALSRLSGALLVYDKAMEIASKGLELNLQEAIEEQRLEVHYVPLLDKNNKTYAYLRTIKLFDPGRGLIEEEELRRLADNAKQGDVLDEFALDKALDDLVYFDEGVRHKLNLLVLSIGRGTFYKAAWLQHLRRKCAEKGIDVERLCLAIQGGSLSSDEAYCASFSKKAHALGIKTAILGFTAKCPLARVKEIAPDVVSFAPSFFTLDPRLGKAEIDVLKTTAKTLESGTDEFGTIPDLYPLKEVTTSLALERLQSEEEFLR